MLRQDRWDTIVIGAGPSGSTAARFIAQCGFKVLILERERFPGQGKACGGGIPFGLIKQLSLPESIIEKKIYSHILHFPSGVKIYKYRRPIFATVYRSSFDRFLVERAVSMGASLITQCRVFNIIKNKEGTTAITNRGRFFSKLIIFANGASNLAYRMSGVGINLRKNNTYLAIAYELDDKNTALDAFEVFYNPHSIPWGYYWIFPKRDRLNVGVDCLCSKIKKNLRFCLDEFINTDRYLRDKKRIRFIAGLIPACLATRLVSDNVLVIGDAAGMVNPIIGEGLKYAIRTGELAGVSCVDTLMLKRFDRKTLLVYPRRFHRTGEFCWLKIWHLIAGFFSNLDKQTLFMQISIVYIYIARIIFKFMKKKIYGG